MSPTRVVVEWGADGVRVAGQEAGGEPEVWAERAGALPDVVGPTPDQLVLVHPAGRPPLEGPWTHTVAAPVAAAGAVGARVVLDVGRAGARATLVRDGRIVVHREVGVGGDRLDRVVRELLGPDASAAQARRVREELSLLPVSVAVGGSQVGGSQLGVGALRDALTPALAPVLAVLREVLAAAGGPVPVVLVGGVARTPLLADLVDADLVDADLVDGAGVGAGGGGVVVAPVPEAAAVVGALALPWDGTAAPRPAPLPGRRWLPPLPPRRGRGGRTAVVAAVAVLGLLGAGRLIPAGAGPTVVGSGVLVQYGYRLDLPAGWEHTGGLPERRRVLLTPEGAPEGSDLVAVESTPLGYDVAAEPVRAAAELRAEFDAAVAAGAHLSDYAATRVAGRPVTTYHQQDGDTDVDWTVVLDGDAQLSVGCRHTSSGAVAVRTACAVVVASVRRA